MEIIVARHSGFCYGVKKSYRLVDEYLNSHGRPRLVEDEELANGVVLQTASASRDINSNTSHNAVLLNTYGDLIHNKIVVDELKIRGAVPVNSIDEINADTVVIRAHGISPKVQSELAMKNIKLIDGTCQFVKNIHTLVSSHLQDGYDIIMTGSKRHPEVIGVIGHDISRCRVVETLEEAQSLAEELTSSTSKFLIISQTTFHAKKFKEICGILLQKIKNYEVRNTICGATYANQAEVENLSKQVECVIVIGGKHSSNTIKLYEISLKNCPNSFHIENLSEIDVKKFQKYGKIGIVAGASTPKWVIDVVVKKLKNLNKGYL